MDHLIVGEVPELRSPFMLVSFSGWPDAQEAATGAIKYLEKQLSAKKFAEIDPEEFYVFTRTRPHVSNNADGEREIRWPANEFSFWHDDAGTRDLVLFSGVEPQLKWKTYASIIGDVAVQHQVEMVIVLGSLLDAVPHTRAARVTGSANVKDVSELLEQRNVRGAGYEGPTSVTSALMEACTRNDLKYASIWGHSPHYLQTSPNPRVSLALVQRIAEVLGLDISLTDLEDSCVSFDQRVLRAMANSDEATTYIQRLEERYDQVTEGRSEASQEELPSSDVVIQDLEEFLRQQNSHDDADSDGPDDIAGRG